jgi:hypothetical protein
MSPAQTLWKDWDQYESNIFKETPATGESSEIIKATRSLFKDLQSIGATPGDGSITTIETAARDLAEELKNALNEWEPKQGDQPKLLDAAPASGPGGGPAPVTTAGA